MRLAALLLIVLAGLALRLDAAWDGAEENLPDSAAYERLARGLATEGSFEQVGPGLPPWIQPATNYSPGLPLLVGGFFELAGTDGARAARLFLALLASLAIPVTFLLGRELSGYWAGLVGAAVIAFYPTLISDSGMLLTEGLAGLLIGLALLSLFRLKDAGAGPAWVVPGLLFGLGAMVRPEFLLVCLVVATTVAVGRRGTGLRSALVGPVILVTATLFVIAPWAVRNAIELNRFVPLSTGGGQALFTGSYLPSGGDPQRLLPELFEQYPELESDPVITEAPPPKGEDPPEDQVLAALALRKAPGAEPDETLARLGREQYLDALVERPIRLAGLAGQKTYHVWLRGRASLTANVPGRLLHWAILGFALLGLWQVWRTRSFEFRIVAAVLLTVTVIGLILVASPRRALSIWPVVAALTGTGVALTASVLRQRIERPSDGLPVP